MSADEAVAELVTFSCSKEAYVYAPLPPAPSYGHRAELWNPDKWLKVTQAAAHDASLGAVHHMCVN